MSALRLALSQGRLGLASLGGVRSMHQNRTIDRFYKEKNPEKQQPETTDKPMTKLAGLSFLSEPHRQLSLVYARLLRTLAQFPADSAYRVSTEALVTRRLELVSTTPDIAAVEAEIGMGMVEEIFAQAEAELKAARALLAAKAWEPLKETPNLDQWRWPV